MKTVKQIREDFKAIYKKGKLVKPGYTRYSSFDVDVDAAVRYKGKIFKGFIHSDALSALINSGISPEEIDNNLDKVQFGYWYMNKFIPDNGGSDLGQALKYNKAEEGSVVSRVYRIKGKKGKTHKPYG